MSSPYLLQCALRDVLSTALEKFPLAVRKDIRGDIKGVNKGDTKTENTRPVNIYLADIALREKGSAELAPFICLQERSGEDIDGMTRVEILMRLVVYSEDVEGVAHELSNLVQVVRHVLMPFVTRPLLREYRLLLDEKKRLLPWERPLDQFHPFAEAFILSMWDYKGFEHTYFTI